MLHSKSSHKHQFDDHDDARHDEDNDDDDDDGNDDDDDHGNDDGKDDGDGNDDDDVLSSAAKSKSCHVVYTILPFDGSGCFALPKKTILWAS